MSTVGKNEKRKKMEKRTKMRGKNIKKGAKNNSEEEKKKKRKKREYDVFHLFLSFVCSTTPTNVVVSEWGEGGQKVIPEASVSRLC